MHARPSARHSETSGQEGLALALKEDAEGANMALVAERLFALGHAHNGRDRRHVSPSETTSAVTTQLSE